MEVAAEYLIFKGLPWAITAVFLIYWNFFRKKKTPKKENVNPVELEDGRYAVEKPSDEHLTGVEYDSIETDPKFKEAQNYEAIARPPDPKGTPTIRP